ncbi:hypothetical protein ACDI10_14570 [Vreelandella venusta]|uniref:hypothetical protein n=1 Tax=Vreelandella venusta TaxID=44935 RepID=UPI003557EF7A
MLASIIGAPGGLADSAGIPAMGHPDGDPLAESHERHRHATLQARDGTGHIHLEVHSSSVDLECLTL